ncbi:hypothetical protein [uncultured Psychroserpens sp.]|uniref:hypothetical protein n=1 Tax=uncultured Psychroserpens sp. TaxID=255436 RepID=UPI002638DE73|nr:hypothetical protein [uncultured Psychroserpens sp.]
MTKTTLLKPNAIAFLIPLILLLGLVILLNSSAFLANQNQLSAFITIDFIITIPVIYFLLIRKQNISNFTIAPFLIACVIIASYTIPLENQDLLNTVKIWLIPIIEISVLSVVIFKLRKAIKIYKNTVNQEEDFYSALLDTCKTLFPRTVAKLVANEIALLYYGFFNFKKIKLASNEFSNYKGSGILSTLTAIIFVVGIEMITVHLLMTTWSPTVAWVLTILSFYSALQLIGIIRSVPKRPIVVGNDHLVLRFGMLSETIIPFSAIERIEFADASSFDKNKGTKTLSLFGELEHSNMVIYTKTPHTLQFIYGKPKPYTKLLLFVDNRQQFKSQLECHLSK